MEIGAIHWNERIEEYFATTGERAHCLSWIHKRAEELYSFRRTYIDLPVIVLSSVVGFFSAGSSSWFADHQTESGIALGVVSLFVSVLNTIGTYYSWAKRSEGHRIAHLQYAKLYRFLAIEMSLPRDERMTPTDLLKTTRETYDRLQEISPLIPPEVIRLFQARFGDAKYSAISKPEEANGLERIEVYPLGLKRVPSTQSPSAIVPQSPPLRPMDTILPIPPKKLVRQESLGGISLEQMSQSNAPPTEIQVVHTNPLRESSLRKEEES